MQATVEVTSGAMQDADRRLYAAVKRAFDIAAAAVLLLLLAPVMLACAIAVALESSGPVLFRQQRVGERGRPFMMLKFRSMYANVDAAPHRDYALAFIQGKAETYTSSDGTTLFKLVRDPRVTRVGKWLRRTSLDELPQLFNVLKGEMSLVGPRPPLDYETAQYKPSHMQRLAVKPGITGLWQVSGRSSTTFEEMVRLDCAYIERQSLLLDLRILVLTIPVVFARRTAH